MDVSLSDTIRHVVGLRHAERARYHVDEVVSTFTKGLGERSSLIASFEKEDL